MLRTGGCVGKAPVFINLGGEIEVERKEDTNKTTNGEISRKEEGRNVSKKRRKEEHKERNIKV